MRQTYKDLDDLWCEWGHATSAIMKHIDNNEKVESPHEWSFREGFVANHHRDGYSVSITHSAYDAAVKSIVMLDVQAKVAADNSISVKTNRRECVEEVQY